MAAFSILYPYILAGVGGAPAAMVDHAARAALAEFCDKSLAWSHRPAAQLLVAAQSDYTIVLPADSRLAEVRNVWLNGLKVDPLDMDDLATFNAITYGVPGYPFRYQLTDDLLSVRLLPTPANAGDSLTTRIALAPSITATTFPDTLAARYLPALAAGAKAILFAMPRQDWTDVNEAQKCREAFDLAIGMARVADLHGHAVSSVKIHARPFGR